MVGAIDAVCEVARIIGRLKEGAATAGPSVLAAAAADGAGSYPPTPAMKRFADSLVRQKGIKPPPGYKTSISICRKFLEEHAPKKVDDKADGASVGGTGDRKSIRPAQLRYATKIAIGKGVVIPDEAKADAAAMSTRIDQKSSRQATQCRSQDCLQARLQARKTDCATINGTEEDIPDTQS